ncbi:MAG: serine hydrolase, partial [Bacteroidota bacterium]
MRLFNCLLLLCFFIQINAQSSEGNLPPVPNFPYITWEKAGFRQDSIEQLLALIGDTRAKDFRGLVVIKDDKMVVEEYYNTFWRTHIHDIRSAGKSVTAILLGVALQEGLIDNLDQSVDEFFPKEKYPFLNPDYKHITLRHLLDMVSGLDADSDNTETPGNAYNWIAKDNWKDYILQVKSVRKPGEKWVYADIHPVLISLIIEEITGKSLKEYAQEKLFAPIGITEVYWYTNANKQTGAAGNLYFSTVDFAKLGVLVLNEGQWQGKQIIDRNFAQQILHEKNYQLPEEWSFADSYGLLWYKAQRTYGNKTVDFVYAS